MRANSILIHHGYVVTLNREREIYENGAVYLEGNSITEVGRTADLIGKYTADHQIDASGCIVLPGFIDAHNHVVQYLSKGIADDLPVFESLYKRIFPYETYLTEEDVYWSAMGNFLEMIKSGTTCFCDPGGYHPERSIEAAILIGIRGITNRSTRDIEDPTFPLPSRRRETREETLKNAEDLVKRWNGAENDRIRAWFSLRIIFNVSDHLVKAVKELADDYHVGIHAHAACVRGENEEVQRRWGVRSLERYHDLGLFGPNLLLIHMGFPNEREIEWLKAHDVKVVHCPSGSMHFAHGVISEGMIPKMVKAGVTVALGNDSATASRSLDMVRTMCLAADAHKDFTGNPREIGAYKALEMATMDGARALLWEDKIGSLEKGKRADLIIIDTSKPEWHPLADPITNLVYSADGKSVETVIIDGKIIMEHRKLLTVNEREVIENVDRASSEVMKRCGIKIESPWKTMH
ncbi:MAG TPA: amidohydrolase [Thermodesulfobacteriota bacterium]|nr:amidohydrolase [Thermodesulfobacteriota bacterium]